MQPHRVYLVLAVPIAIFGLTFGSVRAIGLAAFYWLMGWLFQKSDRRIPPDLFD